MSEQPHRFDPARYVRKLKGADYLEVKWRLLWLRTEHPEAVIETEMVRLELNPPLAVFRARVSIPGGGSATGWGQEERADFGDYLEKAETKAVGRALGALGYGTQFLESEAGDEPQQPRPEQRRPAAPAGETPVSAGSLRALYARARRKGLSPPQLVAWVAGCHDGLAPESLTMDQARRLWEQLGERPDAPQREE